MIYTLKLIAMAILSFLIGFFSAIPVGAVQVEVIKRALHDKLRPAMAVVAGSLLADGMYGAIALFGIAPFLQNRTIVSVFELVSALLLAVLAFITFKNSKRIHIGEIQHFILKSKRVSFITGFSLAATNPVIIFWWLVGRKVVRDIVSMEVFTVQESLIFITTGAVGLAGYLVILAFVVSWAKKFISNAFMQRVNIGLCILLSVLSVYFAITSLRVLL